MKAHIVNKRTEPETGVVGTENFFTISQMASVEQVIEKSRFIGLIVPLSTFEQFGQAMQKIHKDYPNARHYVYAYRLHEGFIEKASDDGEPQGTGGRPVLDLLQYKNIWNILLVVVRYFGGVLLGTGGLTRAYSGTARLVINESKLKELALHRVCVLRVPYERYEQLKYQLSHHVWNIVAENYSEVIDLEVHVPENNVNTFIQWVDEFSGKQIDCQVGETVWE